MAQDPTQSRFSELDAFLGGGAPAQVQPQAQQPQAQDVQQVRPKRKPVSGLDGIVNAFSDISDPMTRQIAQGLVETEMSRALGFSFKFPDEAELKMQALQSEQQLRGMMITTAKQNTQIAKAAFESLSPGALAQYGVSGADSAELMESNPDLFLGIVKDMGGLPFELTRFDLALGGEDIRVTGKEVSDRKREKSEQVAKDLQTRKSTYQSAVDLPKLLDEFDPKGRAEATLSQIDKETGQDIWGVGDSAIDEPRGAAALFSVTDRIRQENPGELEAPVLMEFLKAKGGDITDALEELVDDQGVLHMGRTGDVDDAASFQLVNTLARTSKRLDVPLHDVFQRIGLKAIKLDIADFGRRWFNEASPEQQEAWIKEAEADPDGNSEGFNAWVASELG